MAPQPLGPTIKLPQWEEPRAPKARGYTVVASLFSKGMESIIKERVVLLDYCRSLSTAAGS
ncbi:hypothetical protein SAMN05216605_12435 [Pseudomonas abietaniphila]|uniref:Uncharacterized protein n=1 Tax=Pseudomonas abietaniphila TaxID=89065 RepID=A0A1G8S628_9PSED|nr:hypothetical protein SAMN05216605_12435 [Pseudomonas abietaniphila]